MMNIRRVLISWDFLLAMLISSIAYLFLPKYLISSNAVKDVYNMGITVLSIIFSLFFAALTLIISSSDNEFINFMEEQGDYTLLISTFQFCLWLLFGSLIYSIIIYYLTSLWISDKFEQQYIWFLVGFIFLFCYSLFSVLGATNDAIQYSKTRAKYIRIKNKQKAKNN